MLVFSRPLMFIKRENMKRKIDVGGNIEEGHNLDSVAKEVRKRLAMVDFPAGYYPELLGEYTERQKSQSRLLAFSALGSAYHTVVIV